MGTLDLLITLQQELHQQTCRMHFIEALRALDLQPGWHLRWTHNFAERATAFRLSNTLLGFHPTPPDLVIPDAEIVNNLHGVQLKVLAWICEHAGRPRHRLPLRGCGCDWCEGPAETVTVTV